VPVSKKVLYQEISRKTGLSQVDSQSFVNNFFSSIVNKSESGLSIRNFGNFFYKMTPERIGRNPKTMEVFKIKPRRKLYFNPSSQLRKDIN
tara:strand:+ start:19017 stop:19289 length:273 start_codon:yes stop_codon:yes gene_type:complete